MEKTYCRTDESGTQEYQKPLTCADPKFNGLRVANSETCTTGFGDSKTVQDLRITPDGVDSCGLPKYKIELDADNKDYVLHDAYASVIDPAQNLVVGEDYIYETGELTVTNPSACRNLRVVSNMNNNIKIFDWSGIVDLTIKYDYVWNGVAYGVFVDNYRKQSNGIEYSTIHFFNSDPINFTILPGQTAVLKTRITVTVNDNTLGNGGIFSIVQGVNYTAHTL